MSVTESQRLHLFKTFEDLLPHDDVATMMAMFPPTGWADLATKQDLEHLRVATKQDIEAHRIATKQDFDHLRQDFDRLRQDFAAHRADTKRDLAEHRVAAKKELDQAVTLLRSEMATKDDLRAQTNRFVTWMVAGNSVLVAVFGMLLLLK